MADDEERRQEFILRLHLNPKAYVTLGSIRDDLLCNKRQHVAL